MTGPPVQTKTSSEEQKLGILPKSEHDISSRIQTTNKPLHDDMSNLERDMISKIQTKDEPLHDDMAKLEKQYLASQKQLQVEKRHWRKWLLLFVVIHNCIVYGIVIFSGMSMTMVNFWLDSSVLTTLIGSGTITATTYILTKAAKFAFE